jgi:hypothetical protein
MDITSPFFVVPLLAVVFLACILSATLTDKEQFHETAPDESSPNPKTH